MVIKNEARRRLSQQIFSAAIKEAAESFARALEADAAMPLLRLSRVEFESGNWPIPEAYEPFILRILAEIVVHHQYEISDTQLREALIRGAERADRLIVEGPLSPSQAPTIANFTPRQERSFHWSLYEIKASN